MSGYKHKDDINLSSSGRYVQVQTSDLQDFDLEYFSKLLNDKDIINLTELTTQWYPADLANIFNAMHKKERRILFELMPEIFSGEVLLEVNDDVLNDIVSLHSPKKAANVIGSLSIEEIVSILQKLSGSYQVSIGSELPNKIRKTVARRLTYEPTTTGRIMRDSWIQVKSNWSVSKVMWYIRSNKHDLPDMFYDIFIVNDDNQLIGVIKLDQILRYSNSTIVGNIMNPNVFSVSRNMSQEDIVHIARKYELTGIPVVGDNNTIEGVIIINDFIEFVTDQNHEALLRMGGVPYDDSHAGILKTSYGRFPWLLVNFFTAAMAASVIGFFLDVIRQNPEYAGFMPIVSSMAGVAGSQSATVTVRKLTNNYLLSGYNFLRSCFKEFVVGIVNGFLILVPTMLILHTWFGANWQLGLVFTAAVMITCAIGGIVGIIVPSIFDFFDIDPAITSTVFVTLVTDSVGFAAFLLIASLLLS